MTSRLNPYLSFKNNARAAMEFYKTVFGGDLNITTYGEAQMAEDPQNSNLIMHSELSTGNGIFFMASDVAPGMPYTPGANVSMSLSGENDLELSGYFHKLAQGGTVTVPLETAPWGDKFGMLTDPFGIDWMVNITTPKA